MATNRRSAVVANGSLSNRTESVKDSIRLVFGAYAKGCRRVIEQSLLVYQQNACSGKANDPSFATLPLLAWLRVWSGARGHSTLDIDARQA